MRTQRWVAVLFPVLAAWLALAPSASAAEAEHIDETYIDPFLSQQCGFPVLEHDVGILQYPQSRRGITFVVNVRQTLTNAGTGESVILQTSGAKRITPDFSGPIVRTITAVVGLNYLLTTADGVVTSAGRGVWTLTPIVENGVVVDIQVEEESTPHLAHAHELIPVICAELTP